MKTIEDEVKESETSRFHRWLEKKKARMHAHPVMRHLYKPLVIGVGGFCLIAGLIMLVTPAPAGCLSLLAWESGEPSSRGRIT